MHFSYVLQLWVKIFAQYFYILSIVLKRTIGGSRLPNWRIPRGGENNKAETGRVHTYKTWISTECTHRMLLIALFAYWLCVLFLEIRYDLSGSFVLNFLNVWSVLLGTIKLKYSKLLCNATWWSSEDECRVIDGNEEPGKDLQYFYLDYMVLSVGPKPVSCSVIVFVQVVQCRTVNCG